MFLDPGIGIRCDGIMLNPDSRDEVSSRRRLFTISTFKVKDLPENINVRLSVIEGILWNLLFSNKV